MRKQPQLQPSWFQILVVAALFSLVGAGLITWIIWHSRLPFAAVQERQPGMDRATTVGTTDSFAPYLAGKLVPGPGTPADITGAWPRFRGSNGDNIAITTPLDRQWKPLWKVDLGEGYAGAVVRDGRVYVFDYDQTRQADALRCLSLADGREIWRFTYPIKIKRNHGMSRTVPTLAGNSIVALGPKCHLICLNATTGQFLWGSDLVKDFGVEVPQWYAGQSPLVESDRVVLGTGGDALLVALDLGTGKLVWKTPNPRDWEMTHSSVVPMVFNGKRQYIYCASGGVAGVDAETGALLWETDAWQISIATIASPLPVGGNKLFFSGGYNSGALMLQLKENEGRPVPEVVFRLKAAEFGATQHTPILYQDHIYGVRPDGQLACLDLDGKVRWTSGSANRFGLGPFLIAGNQILALNDDGWLTLAEATPSEYRQQARARILNGHDAWGPMALVGGRLLARDLTQMVCLDMTGGKQ